MPVSVDSSHEFLAREQFNRWSRSREFRRLEPWLVYIQRHILDTLRLDRTAKVLDIGCGSGWAVQEASRRLGSSGGAAFGCDISPGMLAQQADGAHLNSHLTAASAQALPYGEGVFDAAFCTIAFHHFPSPAESLQEVSRVLRPGGRIVVADTCRDLSMGSWIWDFLHRRFEDGHIRYYSQHEITQLLRESFEDVRFEKLSPPRLTTRKFFNRVGVASGRKPM